jgi:transcriptional regulator with XRE-family HTH domain
MASSINGELLKAARLRRGLSLASWARELMVSETQLRSLEEGTDRGFYNDNHRVQVAQKYAAVLGVEAAALFATLRKADGSGRTTQGRVSGSSVAVASLKQEDVALALARAHEGGGDLRGSQLGARSKQARIEYWVAGAVLAGLAGWFSVDAWQHHRGGQRSDPLAVVEKRLDDPPSALNARPVELAKGGKLDLALAKPNELDYPQPFVTKPNDSKGAATASANAARERFPSRVDHNAKESEPRAIASKERAQDKNQDRSSSPGQVHDRNTSSSQDRLASAGKELRYPDRKAIAEASDGLQSPQNTGVALAGQPGAGLIAAASGSGPESRNLDLCEVSDRMASVVVPVSRLKNTPYVHVASGVSQKVCVRSADGRVERLSLSANEARSIFGKAPFTVVSEQPSSVEIFYLGARVRHNGESRVLKIVDPDPIS